MIRKLLPSKTNMVGIITQVIPASVQSRLGANIIYSQNSVETILEREELVCGRVSGFIEQRETVGGKVIT